MGVKVKNLLGQRVERLSKELGIPKVTVEKVIRGYLGTLTESALKGEDIVIDNIVSIKIYENDLGDKVGRGRVSTSLKRKLEELEEDEDIEVVEDVASTYRKLQEMTKRGMKGVEKEDEEEYEEEEIEL